MWIEMCKISSWTYKRFFKRKPFGNANWGWTGVNCANKALGHPCFISSVPRILQLLLMCAWILYVCFERGNVLPFLNSLWMADYSSNFFLKPISFPETLNLIPTTQCVRNEVIPYHFFLRVFFFLNNFIGLRKYLHETLDFLDFSVILPMLLSGTCHWNWMVLLVKMAGDRKQKKK